MNETPILTIIVPSYQTKAFLEDTLPHYFLSEEQNSLQVFLIDDGSDEETSNALETWSEKNPNLFKVFHKKNGGHGSVINFAIPFLESKYFQVIDGDDYPCQEALPPFMAFLRNVEADVVFHDVEHLYVRSKKTRLFHFGEEERRDFDENDAFFAKAKGLFQSHAITYRTDFYRAQNILLREKVFYDDALYCAYPLIAAHHFAYCPLSVVTYRLELPGQSVASASFQKHLEDHRLVSEDLLDFAHLKIENLRKTPLKEALLRHVAGVCSLHYSLDLRFYPEGKKVKEALQEFDQKVQAVPEVNALLEKDPLVKKLRRHHFQNARILYFHHAKVLRFFGRIRHHLRGE